MIGVICMGKDFNKRYLMSKAWKVARWGGSFLVDDISLLGINVDNNKGLQIGLLNIKHKLK